MQYKTIILVDGEPIKKAVKGEDGFFRFDLFWSSELMLNLSITEAGDVLPELEDQEEAILIPPGSDFRALG
ncbi:hypothetical protein LCGC14_2710320 [marine sediment metagenome]|uniref:Uncharacterized protein n=1 Tax=marine sediment metagenome TaxID=412755 RepID=A0A0F9C4U1_9ZZZZ